MELKEIMKIAGGALLAAGAGVLCMTVFVPRYQELSELEAQRNGLRDSIAVKEAEVKEFKDMQEMFETDSTFVVMTARRENYMHPREIVFIFPKD